MSDSSRVCLDRVPFGSGTLRSQNAEVFEDESGFAPNNIPVGAQAVGAIERQEGQKVLRRIVHAVVFGAGYYV